MSEQQPGMPEAPKLHSAAWRLQGIFFEPSRTFEEINLRPSWVLPLLACMLLAGITTQVIFSYVDFGEVVRSQIMASSRADQMSSEQVDQIVEQSSSGPMRVVFQYVMPVLGPLIAVLLTSGVLMLAIYLGGAETSFKKILAVTTHTFFFYSFVGSILAILVFSLSSDPASINIQNPVFTNVGGILSPKESPVLYKLLSGLDILVFYHIYLIGLGLSKVAERLSLSGGVTMTAVVYGLYLGVQVAWTAIFG